MQEPRTIKQFKNDKICSSIDYIRWHCTTQFSKTKDGLIFAKTIPGVR